MFKDHSSNVWPDSSHWQQHYALAVGSKQHPQKNLNHVDMPVQSFKHRYRSSAPHSSQFDNHPTYYFKSYSNFLFLLFFFPGSKRSRKGERLAYCQPGDLHSTAIPLTFEKVTDAYPSPTPSPPPKSITEGHPHLLEVRCSCKRVTILAQ